MYVNNNDSWPTANVGICFQILFNPLWMALIWTPLEYCARPPETTRWFVKDNSTLNGIMQRIQIIKRHYSDPYWQLFAVKGQFWWLQPISSVHFSVCLFKKMEKLVFGFDISVSANQFCNPLTIMVQLTEIYLFGVPCSCYVMPMGEKLLLRKPVPSNSLGNINVFPRSLKSFHHQIRAHLSIHQRPLLSSVTLENSWHRVRPFACRAEVPGLSPGWRTTTDR